MKFKVLLFVILLLSFALVINSFNNVHASGNVLLSTQPSNVNVNVGDAVTINVILDPEGDSVSAAELHFSYDSSILQGQSITAGSLLPVVLVAGTNSNGSAAITLGAQPTVPATNTGTLATLTFKALKSGSTTINLANSLTASLNKVGDTAGQPSGTTVNVGGAVSASTSTSNSTSAASSLPSASGGITTVAFDELTKTNQALIGQYPKGVINWGSGSWFLSAPWFQLNTNSVSFYGPKMNQASFAFVNPKILVSLKIFNGGFKSSNVTLSCGGNTTKNITLGSKQSIDLPTGWTVSCPSVTLTSSNGWNTNFDDLVVK